MQYIYLCVYIRLTCASQSCKGVLCDSLHGICNDIPEATRFAAHQPCHTALWGPTGPMPSSPPGWSPLMKKRDPAAARKQQLHLQQAQTPLFSDSRLPHGHHVNTCEICGWQWKLLPDTPPTGAASPSLQSTLHLCKYQCMAYIVNMQHSAWCTVH